MSYDQDALDAASLELHKHFLREGSWFGTKACEEIGRIFMTAYGAAARPEAAALGEALELLRDMEFVTVLPSKCPICLGWEPKGSGETSRHHNNECRLDAFLKRHQPQSGRTEEK